MSLQPQKVKHVSQTATLDSSIVSARDRLNYSPPADRLATFLQGSLWPLMVIAVGTLASVLWTLALLWLVGRAFW